MSERHIDQGRNLLQTQIDSVDRLVVAAADDSFLGHRGQGGIGRQMDCIALASFTHTRTLPLATSNVAKMDCIARVSFTHTRTPPRATSFVDNQAAEMDCIAHASFTHTRTPPQAISFVDNQAAEMDCIALVSFTHTRRHRDCGRTREIMAAQSCEMGNQLPRSPAKCARRSWRS